MHTEPCILVCAEPHAGDIHPLTFERVPPQGYEIVRTTLPAVVMIGGEAGELRYPSMIQRREAKNKPVTTWNLAGRSRAQLGPAASL